MVYNGGRAGQQGTQSGRSGTPGRRDPLAALRAVFGWLGHLARSITTSGSIASVQPTRTESSAQP